MNTFFSQYTSYFLVIEDKRLYPGIGSARPATAGTAIMGAMVWIIGTAAAMGHDINDGCQLLYSSNPSYKPFFPCRHLVYRIPTLQSILDIIRRFVLDGEQRLFIHMAIGIGYSRAHPGAE